MATAQAAIQNYNSDGDVSVKRVVWVLTTANTDGAPLEFTEWADRTFQFGNSGDTLGGAVGAVEGSNDGVTWYTLSNAAGATPATFSAFGIKTIIELPQFMRPNLTTPGAGASITVTLIARRANPLRT